MSNRLTPALCAYLESLGLPIFVKPSRNTDTGKVEIAMYIFDIEQTDEKFNEVYNAIRQSSYVGEK